MPEAAHCTLGFFRRLEEYPHPAQGLGRILALSPRLTALCVIGVLPDLDASSKEFGLDLGGRSVAKATHEPSLVEPADPDRGVLRKRLSAI